MKTIDYIKSLNENEVYSQKVRIEFALFEVKDTILPFLESLEDNYEKERLLKTFDNAKIIKYSPKKSKCSRTSNRSQNRQSKREDPKCY